MSRWVCRFSLVQRTGRLFEVVRIECQSLVACILGVCLVIHRESSLCLRVVLWLFLGDEMKLGDWSAEVVAVGMALVVLMLKQAHSMNPLPDGMAGTILMTFATKACLGRFVCSISLKEPWLM
jgi:hypothetical protein